MLRHHANAVYSLGQTSTLEAARLIYARIRKLMDKDSKFSVRDIKQKKWRGIHDDKLIDEVLQINLKLAKIHHALFVEPSPGPVKYAAELLNLCSSETRLPLVPIKESTKSLVLKSMSEISLI